MRSVGKWAVFATMLLAGWGRAEPAGVAIRMDLAYGPLPEQRGDLYLPAPGGRLHPAAILIHGGGWIEGSREGTRPYARVLAEHGVATFTVNYRLANPASPATRWPAQLADVQLAVRWLRTHAAEFGIDPARLGAAGDSAGGTLALQLGTLARPVAGEQDGLYPDQSPQVQAVIDDFGVIDVREIAGADRSVAALFGTASPPADALQSLSPLAFISAGNAPTLIVHGRQDAVVPFAQSQRLLDALRARGVKADLVAFDGGHEYAGLRDDAIAASLQQQAAWMAQALAAPR